MARRKLRYLPIPASALFAVLAGCATTQTQQWGVTGGDRGRGVVQVSYDYAEFHQPADNDAQALNVAVGRCNGWGFDDAEPIEGQLRQCSNMDGSNCDLWTVTREYQCTTGTAYARNLSK